MSLEELTSLAVEVRKLATICTNDDLIVALARLKDALAGKYSGEPTLMVRHNAIESILIDRQSGKSKRSVWFVFTVYQGHKWAVSKLSGIWNPVSASPAPSSAPRDKP